MQYRRHRFNPSVGNISWRRKWQSCLVFLLGKSHGKRSLVGYSPWGHRESDVTEHAPYVPTNCIYLLIPNS